MAEVPQEAPFTVSADGPTKDEAIKNALRSAIESVYGAFVSANTTMLNDELVKDEIVTVTNGSIKSYKEVSAVENPKGGWFVTVQGVVSLPHLITYAKSHGSECEFAGSTFGMEMKMRELQKVNEMKVLNNLSDQIIAMLPSIMEYKIEVGEPRIPEFNFGETFSSSDSQYYWGGRIYSCAPLRYKDDGNGGVVDKKAYEHLQQFRPYNLKKAEDSYYQIPITIKWKASDYSPIESLVKDVYSSISMTKEEAQAYEDRGMDVSIVKKGLSNKMDEYRNRITEYYYFRNSIKDIKKWYLNLLKKIEDIGFKFVVKDNTGQTSDIFAKDVDEKYSRDITGNRDLNHISDKNPVMIFRTSGNAFYTSKSTVYGYFGTGIFFNLFEIKDSRSINQVKKIEDYYGYRGVMLENIINEGADIYPEYNLEMNVFIPKNDINKYSKFWVEPKQ
ncbi:MAG: hypothetical protein K2N08_06375 [Muribaculaceae bacterium]|nr:hypothetical protein [Muribaculaceae bacterium]